jgi:hypothetical protein
MFCATAVEKEASVMQITARYRIDCFLTCCGLIRPCVEGSARVTVNMLGLSTGSVTENLALIPTGSSGLRERKKSGIR